MNTVGDIIILKNLTKSILARSGICVTDVGKMVSDGINERIREVIIRAFFTLCLDEKKSRMVTREELPSLSVMCRALGAVDQETPLPQFAQGAYYCAVAAFIMMEGGGNSEEDLLSQLERADMLVNVCGG